MTLRPPSHRAICKPCPGDHPDAAKCDPQNWPTEKNRQKVPPFGVGTRLSALSRQNRHHLVAQFCASSALFRECLERAEKPATGWLGRQDSNLGSRDQNPLPYRLATPQFTLSDF
jgi:hypothetical protein